MQGDLRDALQCKTFWCTTLISVAGAAVSQVSPQLHLFPPQMQSTPSPPIYLHPPHNLPTNFLPSEFIFPLPMKFAFHPLNAILIPDPVFPNVQAHPSSIVIQDTLFHNTFSLFNPSLSDYSRLRFSRTRKLILPVVFCHKCWLNSFGAIHTPTSSWELCLLHSSTSIPQILTLYSSPNWGLTA